MNYTQEDLAAAIAILSDADLDDGVIDQVDEMVICFAKEKVQIETIMDAEAEGEMNEQEADAAIAEAVTDHAQARLDIFDLEIDIEEFSQPESEMISFSQATGATIANLIDAEYPNSQAGKNAIAGATGLSLAEVDRLILGDVVPDTDISNSIAACFAATQTEEGFKEFMDLTSRAMQEVAQFSSPQDSEQMRSREDSQLRAEFEAMRQQSELANVLRVLDKKATSLVSDGYLTPFEKEKLLGGDLEKEEGVALFSAACATNSVPVDTQVDRIRYYLSVAEARGQVIQFSDPKLIEDVTFVEDKLGEKNAKDYFNRNGFG